MILYSLRELHSLAYMNLTKDEKRGTHEGSQMNFRLKMREAQVFPAQCLSRTLKFCPEISG